MIGTFNAKIKDYGFTNPKEGKTPSVMVVFNYENEGDVFKITWFGSFNGGAREFTTRTLSETLGFAGKDVSAIAEGIGSGVLNEGRDYEIVIKPNEYMGKVTERVAFINISGAERKSEKMNREQAKALLKDLKLEFDFAKGSEDVPF